MRWKLNIKPYDDVIETWFAWLPVEIGVETRWLERVWVKGYYKKDRGVFYDSWEFRMLAFCENPEL